ncbi:recombinase family protein [Nocardioides sp. AX2bis]|uniref:recombinase family protein n=1 Tax=Nocardioides sp. AX2bis TaxID=2653157 RepID=UPI0012F1C9CE|nr:recombinase family protein [Nocardioides sp. AX2bis]VXB92875.1 Resolvase [Nocardioides sp. AX2bis]
MPERRAVAIYARISQDRDGQQLGVRRQLSDCRAEADRLGWTVAEEYVDDDISAYSGKARPAYQRMLEDLDAGHIDAVMAWHVDRLYRRPSELEQFISACERARVSDLHTVSGSFDLATGDGMLVARMLAAVAANESDSKRRRGKRKMQEIAEAGQPHGGGTRPFGFLPDRVTHDQTEAEVIRQIAERVLAGESLPSVGRWMDANDIRTVTGKQWRTPVIRGLLLNRRICGERVHNGKVMGPAAWEPIISTETADALHRLLTAPERRTNRAARNYLLSGMCRCAKCGNKMVSSRRYETRRYICRSGLDGGSGCGSITVTAEPVELIVARATLMRLDSRELQDALAGRVRDDAQAASLYDKIAADEGKLVELAGLWASDDMTTDGWKRAKAIIEQRLTENRQRLSRLSGTRQLDAYLGQGGALQAQWSGLNLDRQRAIVKVLVDHVVINPGVIGARSVAVERVRPVWRF